MVLVSSAPVAGYRGYSSHPGGRALLDATDDASSSVDGLFDKIMKKFDINADIGNKVLRRSFNTNMVRAGVDRIVLRSIMGHTTEALTARYYGASEADKAGAVSRLPIDLPKA